MPSLITILPRLEGLTGYETQTGMSVLHYFAAVMGTSLQHQMSLMLTPI